MGMSHRDCARWLTPLTPLATTAAPAAGTPEPSAEVLSERLRAAEAEAETLENSLRKQTCISDLSSLTPLAKQASSII